MKHQSDSDNEKLLKIISLLKFTLSLEEEILKSAIESIIEELEDIINK
jgi:hypothetical protein